MIMRKRERENKDLEKDEGKCSKRANIINIIKMFKQWTITIKIMKNVLKISINKYPCDV